MTKYYALSDNGKRRFLYIELTKEQADMIEHNVVKEPDGHRIDPRLQLHDHGCQYHLTTDGAFNRYRAKRKETPLKVYIVDTIKQMEATIEKLGYIL